MRKSLQNLNKIAASPLVTKATIIGKEEAKEA
jgi:hypothetical protein